MNKRTTAKKMVGYQGRDTVSHRKYNRGVSLRRAKKTGNFTFRGTKVGGKVIYGLGHKAGEDWGDKREIDPTSRVRKYSKNSPSFDEGVYKSKQKRKVAEKM